jgi:hypothetical protein
MLRLPSTQPVAAFSGHWLVSGLGDPSSAQGRIGRNKIILIDFCPATASVES